MKKTVYILLVLLFLTVLTGCACQHEWTQPDCLNPAVCTKCQETGAEALGHDWADATCQSPQTCLRCSETQGTPLMHSYGDWSFHKDDEQMSHACSTCGYVDYWPIDWDLYWESILVGYWDLWSVYDANGPDFGDYAQIFGVDGNLYSASAYFFAHDRGVAYLAFGENRTFTIKTENIFIEDNDILTGSWSYTTYRMDGSIRTGLVLNLSKSFFGTKSLPIEIIFSENGKLMLVLDLKVVGADVVLTFYQEQDEILEGICGSWAITDEKLYTDKSYCIQLRPDRTAICYVEGIFEGTWSLGANPFDRSYIAYNIEYIRDGKPEIFYGYYYLPGEYYDVPTLELSSNSTSFDFHEISEEELTIHQEATTSLIGTWRSMGDFPNPELADEINNAYTITFLENGTFELQHENGRTYTGRWSAFNCQKDYYQYHLYLDKQNITFQCILYAYDDYNSHYLLLHYNGGGKYQEFYFLRDLQDNFPGL